MTAFQFIETKISELSKEELHLLLEKVSHELKSQLSEYNSNREHILIAVLKLKGKNLFPSIKDPILWQQTLRNEWEV